jgi:hypothetical protein
VSNNLYAGSPRRSRERGGYPQVLPPNASDSSAPRFLSLWTRSAASILPAIRFGSCRVGDRAVRTPSAAPREVPVRDDLSPLLAAVVRDVDATVRNAALAPGSPSASLASSGRCFSTQPVSKGGSELQRADILSLWDDLRFIRGERRVQNRARRPLPPLAHEPRACDSQGRSHPRCFLM